ncbi:hypothetical protein [Ralstonia mannitolilytica]|uniref:hypothetical protein n=1 Tax=Ralstonia mannitolilytica TaxID=105219 RepID=UPI0012FD116D|nr:hypothetical protein [Ralstonia mannitolilytica]
MNTNQYRDDAADEDAAMMTVAQVLLFIRRHLRKLGFTAVVAAAVAFAIALAMPKQWGSMSFRVESNTVTGASPARTGWPAGA